MMMMNDENNGSYPKYANLLIQAVLFSRDLGKLYDSDHNLNYSIESKMLKLRQFLGFELATELDVDTGLYQHRVSHFSDNQLKCDSLISLRANLRENDLIFEINDMKTSQMTSVDIVSYLYDLIHKPTIGDEKIVLKLLIYRDKKKIQSVSFRNESFVDDDNNQINLDV